MVKVVDAEKEKLEVNYCIPIWLRNEQMKHSCARFTKRIAPEPVRKEMAAIVGFGPSLEKTWEELRRFKYIFSCSGSHKFLMDRGITPTWHVEVDPRKHKVELIGDKVSKETVFLMASCCHPQVFDHLEKHGADIRLWHTYGGETQIEMPQVYPRGRNEWVLTGGANVGLRALVLARFLGFTNLHIFGMDGSFPAGEDGKRHAAEHPNRPKSYILAEYNGKQYATTTAFLECARGTFHELEQLPDVSFTFYGEGLIQDMAKSRPVERKKSAGYAFFLNPLISPEYLAQQKEMFKKYVAYGTSAMLRVDRVKLIYERNKFTSLLDYGCGRGMLAKNLDFPIFEYDPALPGKDNAPRPADLVVCMNVLEHVEPWYLDPVINDILRCCKSIVYFVIALKPANKPLPNGENSHLIIKKRDWWVAKLRNYFTIPDDGVLESKDGTFVEIVGAPKTVAPVSVSMKEETCAVR